MTKLSKNQIGLAIVMILLSSPLVIITVKAQREEPLKPIKEEPHQPPGTPIPPGPVEITEKTCTSITIRWRDNSTDERGFWVNQNCQGTLTTSKVISSDVEGTGEWVSFTDTDLTPGCYYYCYAVLAYNEHGNSFGQKPTCALVPLPPEALANLTLDNPHKNYAYYHKGQIHCHTGWKQQVGNYTVHMGSDGKQSPTKVEEEYLRKGYTFICVTDHNQAMSDPEVPGILHIISGEDGYRGRHHLLALGINFEKVKYYHDNVDSDRDGDMDGLDNAENCICDNIQSRVDYITQIQKAIAVLAHPQIGHNKDRYRHNPVFDHWGCDDGWSLDDLKDNSNYTGIEIFTGSGNWSLSWWDVVLSMGKHKRIWGFGADDCHNVEENLHNFNRAWIVVNSNIGPAEDFLSDTDLEKEDELRQDILSNIKLGNFYTVVRSPNVPPKTDTDSDGPEDIGPDTVEISVSGYNVRVETKKESESITFCASLLSGSARESEWDMNTNSATYTLTGHEDYVRVEVRQKGSNEEEYVIFSQPLYVIEVPTEVPPDPCKHIQDMIAKLQTELRNLQEELKNATPTQKKYFKDEIKKVNFRIGEQQEELRRCRVENPNP